GRVERAGERFAMPGRRAKTKEVRRSGPGGGTRQLLEGSLTVHRDGFGFVDVGAEEDIFVPPHEARRALDGDRVKVEVLTSRGRSEGRIVGVVLRQREALVGTYVERAGNEALVRPNDPSMPAPVRVPRTQLARDGDVVTVRLGVGADLLPPGGLVGEVTGSLGRPGDPSQDVLAIVFGQGFSQEFPPEVMDEADRIPLHVPATELHEGGRRDLRALSLVTIDGADARDFDDAVHAEDQPGGAVRLWVAIADVSHYVRPGSALDTEAFRRGTSVYLPDRVLPMLPERLSNGICSLRPDEDRLCLVAEMVFDASGRRTQTELYPAVMRSAARCTYEEVQQVLDGEPVPTRDRFRPLFQRLQKLGRLLRGVREQRGAIDFDLPETRPQLDESGRPVRMVRRERKESHRIVEDCMLAANEAVAAFFQEKGLPSVYRFHAEPDPDKLATFGELARAHGLMVPGKGEPTSRELNLFMRGLVGHPGQRALNQLLLRSMMQAVYSPDQVGHYGLGAEEYLHFTSPIRRYPDLLVHRLLRAQWERRQRARPERELENEVEELRRMAAHSSERERAAMKCEREVNSLYACLLMEDRVGEEFAATVSSITDFGLFVELDTEHVEGLVRADELGPGHKLVVGALTWPTGRRVQVGQVLTVRLAGVNVQRRQMDFDVVAFAGEQPLARRTAAERAEGARGRGERSSRKPREPAPRQPGKRRPGEFEQAARTPDEKQAGKGGPHAGGAGREQRSRGGRPLAAGDRQGAGRHAPEKRGAQRGQHVPESARGGQPAAAEKPRLKGPEHPAQEGRAQGGRQSQKQQDRGGRVGAEGQRQQGGRRTEEKQQREQPGKRGGERPQRQGSQRDARSSEQPARHTEQPEPQPSAASGSPHPGFDRLRALAGQQGKGSRGGSRQGSRPAGGARDGGRGERNRGSSGGGGERGGAGSGRNRRGRR
ncbi:MAG: ribonuclease R, partial [Myxococcaceae bacterium]